MILELVALGWLAGNYIYHRIEDQYKDAPPSRAFSRPRVDQEAVVPLIYGRVKVDHPIPVWYGNFRTYGVDTDGADTTDAASTVTYRYEVDILYAIGIPFRNGTGYSQIDSDAPTMWFGDTKVQGLPAGVLSTVGSAGHATYFVFNHPMTGGPGQSGNVAGFVEYFYGKIDQFVVGGIASIAMNSDGIIDADIPGYRNIALACLSGAEVGFGWSVGTEPQMPDVAFEITSFPEVGGGLIDEEFFFGNHEANPAEVLYDLLTRGYGKLNLGETPIDVPSFTEAAQTLFEETHTYSRVFDERTEGSEIIQEILRQIDGVLYEYPGDEDNLPVIKLKLVRMDYDPTTVPLINPSNCARLESFAQGGWTAIPNKIKLSFTNRDQNYKDDIVYAQNQANLVGQDGQVTELQLQFPGICTKTLAQTIAGRELAARSRPLVKCRVCVDRTFYNTYQGDVVALTWPEYGLSGKIMRVADVNRGVQADGMIQLDLLEEYFYVHRGTFGSHAGGLPPLGLDT